MSLASSTPLPTPDPSDSSGPVPAEAGRVPGASGLRADAERNRRNILRAAATAFSEKGADVPMEEIARAAGVGVGTLYRRFTDRTALVLAVVEENFQVMLTRLQEARAAHDRAWDALVASLGGAELGLSIRPDRPLPGEIVRALREHPPLRELRRELLAGIERLVVAAQAEGSMRADVGTGDVAHLFALAGRSRSFGAQMGERVAARSLGVILDGLRAPAASHLPGEPLTRSDLVRWGARV